MTERTDPALRTAIDQGLLPPDATMPAIQGRPWPVVLLTALGAWLATVPLLAAAGLLLDDLLREGIGAYVVGVVALIAGVLILRVRSLPLFVEQLALPVLLVGLGLLGIGLFRDLPTGWASAFLAAVTLILALALDPHWLRVLLGAVSAGLAGVALLPHGPRIDALRPWVALHGLLGIWVLAVVAQRTLLERGRRAALAAVLEPVGAGWILLTLAGLASFSGATFLVPGVMGREASELAELLVWPSMSPIGQSGSVLLALAGIGWMLYAWSSLRSGSVLVSGAVLTGLAWLLPDLGAVLLALAVTATTHRWRLAAASALAAVWILGSFYYQLTWPLILKALVMIGAGIALALPLWLGRDRRGDIAQPAAPEDRGIARGRLALIAATAILTLAVVDIIVWQREMLIAHGTRLYVELAPVDPRSLMQGDYMRLRFRLPPEIQERSASEGQGAPVVIAQYDARKIAVGWHEDTPGSGLGSHEVRVRLRLLDGDWGLATNAWLFREGEGRCWALARYGELRIGPDGQAILVGLTNEQLRPIKPVHRPGEKGLDCVQPE